MGSCSATAPTWLHDKSTDARYKQNILAQAMRKGIFARYNAMKKEGRMSTKGLLSVHARLSHACELCLLHLCQAQSPPFVFVIVIACLPAVGDVCLRCVADSAL